MFSSFFGYESKALVCSSLLNEKYKLVITSKKVRVAKDEILGVLKAQQVEQDVAQKKQKEEEEDVAQKKLVESLETSNLRLFQASSSVELADDTILSDTLNNGSSLFLLVTVGEPEQLRVFLPTTTKEIDAAGVEVAYAYYTQVYNNGSWSSWPGPPPPGSSPTELLNPTWYYGLIYSRCEGGTYLESAKGELTLTKLPPSSSEVCIWCRIKPSNTSSNKETMDTKPQQKYNFSVSLPTTSKEAEMVVQQQQELSLRKNIEELEANVPERTKTRIDELVKYRAEDLQAKLYIENSLPPHSGDNSIKLFGKKRQEEADQAKEKIAHDIEQVATKKKEASWYKPLVDGYSTAGNVIGLLSQQKKLLDLITAVAGSLKPLLDLCLRALLLADGDDGTLNSTPTTSEAWYPNAKSKKELSRDLWTHINVKAHELATSVSSVKECWEGKGVSEIFFNLIISNGEDDEEEKKNFKELVTGKIALVLEISNFLEHLTSDCSDGLSLILPCIKEACIDGAMARLLIIEAFEDPSKEKARPDDDQSTSAARGGGGGGSGGCSRGGSSRGGLGGGGGNNDASFESSEEAMTVREIQKQLKALSEMLEKVAQKIKPAAAEQHAAGGGGGHVARGGGGGGGGGNKKDAPLPSSEAEARNHEAEARKHVNKAREHVSKKAQQVANLLNCLAEDEYSRLLISTRPKLPRILHALKGLYSLFESIQTSMPVEILPAIDTSAFDDLVDVLIKDKKKWPQMRAHIKSLICINDCGKEEKKEEEGKEEKKVEEGKEEKKEKGTEGDYFSLLLSYLPFFSMIGVSMSQPTNPTNDGAGPQVGEVGGNKKDEIDKWLEELKSKSKYHLGLIVENARLLKKIVPLVQPAVSTINAALTHVYYTLDGLSQRERIDPSNLVMLFEVFRDSEWQYARHKLLYPLLQANSDPSLDGKITDLQKTSNLILEIVEAVPKQLVEQESRLQKAVLVSEGIFGLLLVTGMLGLLAAAATRVINSCVGVGGAKDNTDQNLLTGAHSVLPLAGPFAIVFAVATAAGAYVFRALNSVLFKKSSNIHLFGGNDFFSNHASQVLTELIVFSQDFEMAYFVIFYLVLAAPIGFLFGLAAEIGPVSMEIISCTLIMLFGGFNVWMCIAGLTSSFGDNFKKIYDIGEGCASLATMPPAAAMAIVGTTQNSSSSGSIQNTFEVEEDDHHSTSSSHGLLATERGAAAAAGGGGGGGESKMVETTKFLSSSTSSLSSYGSAEE